MVVSPPTHIENHLLGYYPFFGFEGADVIADRVYLSCKLGLEKHLIDFFGDAGLEYEDADAANETGGGRWQWPLLGWRFNGRRGRYGVDGRC